MAEGASEAHILDNPVWHALRGPLSRFAASHMGPELIRFSLNFGIFSAVDQINPEMWTRIAELVGVKGVCVLFRDAVVPPPSGWEEEFRGPCLQMIAEDIAEPSGLEIVQLGPEDAPEMLALATLTEPGPFFLRTPELGRYVGFRRDGQLVAMAGERFRLPGYVEISAVCTHPDARGEGLGGELTLDVAHSIRARGDQAFLHVVETNENAVRLYQKLGFVVRRKVDVVAAQWHGPDWKPESAQ
jgi:predicted GNAT family acetyltransferase